MQQRKKRRMRFLSREDEISFNENFLVYYLTLGKQNMSLKKKYSHENK